MDITGGISSIYRWYQWLRYVAIISLCAYQCYAPLPPVRAIVGQGGDLTNLNINCPNIRDIPYNQIPLQKVGDYWEFDTRSVTVQYTETIAVFKMSSEVIKCPTIGAASFGQSPYIARYLPVRGVVGHNIDRRIIWKVLINSGWGKVGARGRSAMAAEIECRVCDLLYR